MGEEGRPGDAGGGGAVALPGVCDGETGPHAGIQIRFGPPVALHGVTDQRHRTGAAAHHLTF